MAIDPEISKQRYLKYLLAQYAKGVLQPDKVEKLIAAGMIKTGTPGVRKGESGKELRLEKRWSEMMDPFYDKGNYHMYKQGLTKADWMPEGVLKHTPEFVHWIDSMLYGYFPNKCEYKPFTLYKVQAYRWLQDDDNITSYHTDDSKREYKQREYDRNDENSLYYVNQYGELKEGDIASGYVKYQAREHHAVVCYLFDCGYNLIGGKGRQIGWTSIMGLLADKKLIFQPNYYIKFVTEDKDTGEEIFSDKIKYPFGALPRWMQPKVKSDSGTRFWLSDKTAKGAKGYPNSRIDVVAPKKTAINGGSPQLALIDEIGNIGILGAMLNEARPTMFWNNPKTGKYELKRQVIMWGCVCAGTKVWNNKGDLINIEDLTPEQGIIGYGGKEISKEKITYWQPPHEKECYKITTNTGRFLECSEDHPILWSNKDYGITPRSLGRKFFKQTKFVEAKDIKVGEQVATIESVPVYGDKQMWEPRFIGWLIGDGTYGIDHSPRLSNCDNEINNYVETYFNADIKASHITKDGKVYKELLIKNICPQLRALGIYGQTGINKRLPIGVHSYNKKDICELLGGIFDTDGCVHYTKNQYIDLTSSSYVLLDEVRMLLQKLGIHSNIKRIKANRLTNPKDRNDWYVLYICGRSDIIEFHKNISFYIAYKQDRLRTVIRDISGKNVRLSKTIEGIRFERVVEVTPIGRKHVYNLTAGTTHTYIANGIVTHNTGGSMDRGKGEYEKEWYRILGLWEAKQYDNGFVPLFFSWHCRFDRIEYEKEKSWYYGARAMKEDIDLETSKTQFAQHYPSSFRDMFLTTASTLVSRDIIDTGIERCRSLSPKQQPVYGYFEPIFDESFPMPPESDLPYKLVGAKFVAVDDAEDHSRASVRIFNKPEAGWENRYWQGTDPIATETGHSNFASAIWDEYLKTIPAILNFRKVHDHKYTFLQSVLLGLYYNTAPGINTGVKELVEANIGTNYTDYKELKGFYESLVFNTQLPSKLVGGARLIGVDNKGNRANAIIDYMTELIRTYHDRIFISVVFEQLMTFVQSITKMGREAWGPMNKNFNRDDVLYAITYAYICRQCHMHLYPTKKVLVAERFAIKHRLVRQPDYTVIRQAIKVPIYETFTDGVMPQLENTTNEKE